MPAVIEACDVTKRYPATAALNGVSLEVGPGEAVAVMGPSGSGKSTLLNLVAGLDRPTSGTVTVNGVRVSQLSQTALARFRRRHLGMVFQFFNLLDDLTVLDNILMPAQLAGLRREQAGARADELLERLHIADHRDAYPARLSGGERQRVAIARALMNEPPLLIADEPTGALDTRSGEQVLDLLRDLNRTGQTLLLVTHDPALAARCTSRAVHLVDGQLVDGHLVDGELVDRGGLR
jgi:putative ABC transport system ATP-binding protein